MATENREVNLEYVRASEAVLKLDNLSDEEEAAAVSAMLVRLSAKLYLD
jgi:hypothetical protein